MVTNVKQTQAYIAILYYLYYTTYTILLVYVNLFHKYGILVALILRQLPLVCY